MKKLLVESYSGEGWGRGKNDRGQGQKNDTPCAIAPMLYIISCSTIIHTPFYFSLSLHVSSLPLFSSLSHDTYIPFPPVLYIYIYFCVCEYVCVCVNPTWYRRWVREVCVVTEVEMLHTSIYSATSSPEPYTEKITLIISY